jgi:hypothetical protein
VLGKGLEKELPDTATQRDKNVPLGFSSFRKLNCVSDLKIPETRAT